MTCFNRSRSLFLERRTKNVYFREMENISYHVAAGHIDEELLRRILEAIMNFSYDSDEALKLDIFNAISVVDEFY